MASPLDKCIKLVKAASEGIVSDSQAEQLLKNLKDIDDNGKLSGLDEAARKALLKKSSQDIQDFSELKLIIERRNKVLEAAKLRDTTDFIFRFKEASSGLKAWLGGIESPIQGSRSSVDARVEAIKAELISEFEGELRSAGVMDFLAKGFDEDGLAMELATMKTKDYVPSKNPSVVKAAKVIKNLQGKIRDRMNRAGAWIQELDDYTVKSTHDAGRIVGEGKDAWIAFMKGALNPSTYDGVAPDKFLASAYDAVVTGYRKSRPSETGAFGIVENNYGPYQNIAARLGEHKVFIFKSPEAGLAYNKKFGKGTLRETFMTTIDSASRDIGLMEKMTVKPEEFFNKVMREVETGIRNKFAKDEVGLIAAKKDLDNYKNEAKNIFKTLSGHTRLVDSVGVANVMQTVRAVQVMAKLGGSTLSATLDTQTINFEMRYQGGRFVESIVQPFKSILNFATASEAKKEVWGMTGAMANGVLRDMQSILSATDTFNGKTAKAVELFFRFNLNSFWDNAQRSGMAEWMAQRLASYADNKWDLATLAKENPDAARVLGLYNIDAPRWEALRGAVTDTDAGYRVLTGRQVDSIPDESIAEIVKSQGKKVTESSIIRERDELRTAVYMYYQDRSYHGVFKPTAIETSMITRGTKKGNFEGELFRAIGQFKSYPLTMIQKGFLREYQGRGESWPMGAARAALFSFQLGAVGALVYQSKQVLAGKNALEWNDPKLFAAGMMQGGGLGLYGDFIIGDYSRFGRSALASLAGPSLGQVDNLFQIKGDVVDATGGKGDKTRNRVAAGMVRVARENAPFANLFYAKPFVDNLVWNQLEESLNPGYLKRKETTLKRNTGQEFRLPPSTFVKPSSDPVEFMGNMPELAAKTLESANIK